MLKVTESRVALVLSAIAILATLWQGDLAKRANAFNEEQVSIDAQPSDIPSERIKNVVCWREGITTISLVWRVTFFNGSTQPITIKELSSTAITPAGPSMGIGPITDKGPVDRQFPVAIEPKNFKIFYLPVPVTTSPEFVEWFRKNGGCEGKPVWPSEAGRRIFNESGWSTPNAVRAIFEATTGTGKQFTAASPWP